MAKIKTRKQKMTDPTLSQDEVTSQNESQVEEAVEAQEEVPATTDEVKTKTWYHWLPLDGDDPKCRFGVFHEVVELPEDITPDGTHSQWKPNDPMTEGEKRYFIDVGWHLGPARIPLAPVRKFALDLLQALHGPDTRYSALERETWAMQEAHAREYLKDGTTSAFLKTLYGERSNNGLDAESFEEFCQSIVDAADKAHAAKAISLADYQVKRARVTKATTFVEIAEALGTTVGHLLLQSQALHAV